MSIRIAGWILLVVFTSSTGAQITDSKDRRILAAFLDHARRVPERLSVDHCKTMAAEEPEGYTWKLLPQMDMLLTAYALTGKTSYLKSFVATFKNLRAAMTKGPDGYLGWYGKALTTFRNPDRPDDKVDVIISSFKTVDVLGRFLELVQQKKALERRYARERRDYLDLMENQLIRKWDARGRYVDLGKKGAVYRTHAGLRDVKAGVTQPHNKLAKIVLALVRLHRVTGEAEYLRRAAKLGTRFKHSLTLRDGHYEWNYWDPAGAWDVHPKDQNRWKHWIGPEHRSGYYALSLTQAVLLFHHGVVFTRKDIDRFLRTQLDMTWNGDLENPQFHRVDRSRGKQRGRYICPALAPFHQKIHAFLFTGPRQEERIAEASHPWKGGPLADEYLRGKYLDGPAAKGGKAMFADVGKQFRQSAGNQRFLTALRFTVKGKGYRVPRSPQQMRPLPRAKEESR